MSGAPISNLNGSNGLGSIGQALGTNSSMPVNGVDPTAYQYGNAWGGNAAQGFYDQAGDAAMQNQGAQITNPYATADRGATQGTMAGEGALQGYYQGVLNGTAPSLAAAQMTAATDQNINAQAALAHSVGGSMQSAAADRNAATAGNAAMQSAAQQSMIGRIQEEQNAASGESTLLNNEAGTALGLQGLDATTAYQQAGLQEQQQGINANEQMGMYGLGQTAQGEALQGQEAEQSGQLTAQGQALQQSEYNAGQNTQLLGATVSAAGKALAADLVLKEPSGPRGMRLREEKGFILAQDTATGALGAIRPEPLTPKELSQVTARHGAGPLPPPGKVGPWDTQAGDALIGGPGGGQLQRVHTTLGPRGRAPMPLQLSQVGYR